MHRPPVFALALTWAIKPQIRCPPPSKRWESLARAMSATRGASDPDAVNRRAFLIGLGGGGAALIAGCGGSKSKSAASTSTRTARTTATESSAARTSTTTQSDAQALRGAIRGDVFEPGRPGYAAAARVYNLRFDDRHPRAVARPLDVAAVQNAVRVMVHRGVPLRVRSGGHSYAGYSTLSDGVVIDLSAMNSVSVDRRSQTATVGAGAQLIDVYSALANAGAMLPGGSCPSVGVAGVTLGGGFGLAARRFGLTADHLVSADVVTVDGRRRTVNAQTDADLLWALKGGGGGNFGIVTEFTFTVHPLPSSATYFNVTWPWSSATEAIEAWQSWAPHTTDKVTSILHLDSIKGPPTVSTVGQYLGSSAAVPGLLAPLLAVPGAALAGNVEMPYLQLQLLLAGCVGKTFAACHTTGTFPGATLPRQAFNAKSDYVAKPLGGDGRAAMVAATEAPGPGALLCDSYGGAVNRVAPTATAFAHREQLFCIQYYGKGSSASWIEQAWRKMRPYVSGQAYQNYIDPTLEGWPLSYYAENLPRLEATRRRVDPDHYFDFPQAIGS
jgi:FAD/FMN-containing dehydrogenase